MDHSWQERIREALLMNGEGIIAETRDLTIGYRLRNRETRVMHSLSLSARRGELVALIGRNGTGKSTLLRTLTGLQPALAGQVMLEGSRLGDIGLSQLPRMVSFVSTESLSLRNIKVREVVALGRFPYTNWIGRLTAADNTIIMSALEATGLTLLADRSIDNISDGERQRVLIARAVAQDTGIVVMDEPTAFLDLPSRYGIVSLLLRMTRDQGKCVIYSTHDLDTAINEADNLWLMTEGGIAEGAPEDLILNGTIAKAFESPLLTFSEKEAAFSFVRKRDKKIALIADGAVSVLTARALSRCGYNIDPQATLRVTLVEDERGREWILTDGKAVEVYRSIYDLASRLTSGYW